MSYFRCFRIIWISEIQVQIYLFSFLKCNRRVFYIETEDGYVFVKLLSVAVSGGLYLPELLLTCVGIFLIWNGHGNIPIWRKYTFPRPENCRQNGKMWTCTRSATLYKYLDKSRFLNNWRCRRADSGTLTMFSILYYFIYIFNPQKNAVHLTF